MTVARCMMETAWGLPTTEWEVGDKGRTVGVYTRRCGRETSNPTLVCDECTAEWRLNYPRHPVPDFRR